MDMQTRHVHPEAIGKTVAGEIVPPVGRHQLVGAAKLCRRRLEQKKHLVSLAAFRDSIGLSQRGLPSKKRKAEAAAAEEESEAEGTERDDDSDIEEATHWDVPEGMGLSPEYMTKLDEASATVSTHQHSCESWVPSSVLVPILVPNLVPIVTSVLTSVLCVVFCPTAS